MQRRNFLKSIGIAIAAVPLLSVKALGSSRERIYLKRGEVLEYRHFTGDVEIVMEPFTAVRSCFFDHVDLTMRPATKDFTGIDFSDNLVIAKGFSAPMPRIS